MPRASTRSQRAFRIQSKIPSSSLVSRSSIVELSTESNCELHNTGVCRSRCDAAEGGGSKAAVGLRECRRVGDVEHLGAEFEVDLLDDSGPFDEREIEIAVGGSTD